MKHDIPIRRAPFEFDPEKAGRWHPDQPEWGHMVDGASLTMPYLEPFLIKTMREAAQQIEDPDLLADVRGFVGQEAQHFTCHRRYNERLKQAGYPELEAVEDSYTAGYERLSKRSLDFRLAYSAGFETMTMGITEWLVNDREALFEGADPTIASFALWHMVEETEHKSVAYDVYQSVCGRYGLRVLGLLCGSLHVGWLSRRAYRVMLKKDGQWFRLSSRLALWGMVARFFVKAGGAMVRALAPGYHPDKVADPEWVHRWRASYDEAGGEIAPVLNGPIGQPAVAFASGSPATLGSES